MSKRIVGELTVFGVSFWILYSIFDLSLSLFLMIPIAVIYGLGRLAEKSTKENMHKPGWIEEMEKREKKEIERIDEELDKSLAHLIDSAGGIITEYGDLSNDWLKRE